MRTELQKYELELIRQRIKDKMKSLDMSTKSLAKLANVPHSSVRGMHAGGYVSRTRLEQMEVCIDIWKESRDMVRDRVSKEVFHNNATAQ